MGKIVRHLVGCGARPAPPRSANEGRTPAAPFWEDIMVFTRAIGGALVAVVLSASAAFAGTLVINADTSDPAPRKAWEVVIEQFKKENPSVDVKFNVYDHESYKKSIRNWLTSASPDVVYWYVGTRMKQFSEPGLLEDVSDVYTATVKDELGKVAVGLVTDKGKQYGMPYTYYHWGVYYRKDLFAKAGVTAAPKTWAEFTAACEKIKASGVDPIAIGSKDLWPTAGWFDYLNMRTNGIDFHMSLMGGKVSYTDDRVKAVFAKWKELLDKGCFVKNHASVSWQESQALLYQGKSAMMLIGNFITPNFPKDIANDMDFFAFPSINPGNDLNEDAPMDSIHIPAKAKNKEDAKKFLAFVARADVQESINKALLQVPINSKAAVADDRFLRQGKELLGKATGIAQFFDRDTSEDLATVGMKGFQEFMINPDRADKVIDDIERARKRIYGAN
jgi:multiple sugar transport system substrate-binding protein